MLHCANLGWWAVAPSHLFCREVQEKYISLLENSQMPKCYTSRLIFWINTMGNFEKLIIYLTKMKDSLLIFYFQASFGCLLILDYTNSYFSVVSIHLAISSEKAESSNKIIVYFYEHVLGFICCSRPLKIILINMVLSEILVFSTSCLWLDPMLYMEAPLFLSQQSSKEFSCNLLFFSE